jgi:hypothetical protein
MRRTTGRGLVTNTNDFILKPELVVEVCGLEPSLDFNLVTAGDTHYSVSGRRTVKDICEDFREQGRRQNLLVGKDTDFSAAVDNIPTARQRVYIRYVYRVRVRNSN